MSIQRQNPDGSWVSAEPIGWREEHNWLQRLVFWLRGIEHCNDREGRRGRHAPSDPTPRHSLLEQGRRLASRRDDLIAEGVDPSDLEVPIAPPNRPEETP